MKHWWQRRPLKLRLALWFAATVSGILLGLTPVVYWLIERRLHVELDRQLRIDWNLVQAHLESDTEGHVQWRKGSPATPDSPGYAATWFDVWSGKVLLMRHGPVQEAQRLQPPRYPRDQVPTFYEIELDQGLPARTFEEPARIGGRKVVLRVFRDESGLHRTLREILIAFALGVPLAALLAALGGFLLAGRTLKPISAMADRARQITSESLSQRLPCPNPHDELGRLATVFNQTLQRLQDSFEALKRFTADASHELRTPLTALRAVGEVGLRDNSDAPALRETIGSMLEEAQHLNDLVDSLLLLARIESGRLPLQLEPLRLDELLADVRERVGVLAAEKQQVIELVHEPEVVASADRQLLRQAVMNILHNAIRYSPPGTKVVMRSLRRGRCPVIEIADQGPGIPAEYHQKIFERFFRLDGVRSRTEGGAGLGLAIAKLSVEQQGGSIELESGVGEGSCFRIVLPRPASVG